MPESKCCWHEDDKPCPKHVATFYNASFHHGCIQTSLFSLKINMLTNINWQNCQIIDILLCFQMNMNDTVYDDVDNSSANMWVQPFGVWEGENI